jgi:RHS repeat-associated protein
MPGRKFAQTNITYRYGFNRKENDNEVKGEGNQQDYGLRIYDPRLVRFLSVDPLSSSYPWYTPYQFAGNSPIANIDLDGGEPKPSISGTEKEGDTKTTSAKYITGTAENGIGVEERTGTWNFHAGGAGTGRQQKNGTEILTQPGWYTSEGYINVLKSTSAATALAGELHLFSTTALESPSGSEELSKFVGAGLNQNTEKHLIAAANSLANSRNYAVTGTTYPSSFNVEDIMGLGLLFKEGLKILGTYTAKNLASRSVNLLREAYSIGGGRNIGTLGGVVEGAGYHTTGVSGTASRAGTVGVPLLRRFTTMEVGGYDRLFDSEVKLLEDFAAKFHNTPNVRGTLTLTSERQFCTSCSGVVTQFQKAFPNVQLNVINGVK